MLIIKTILKHVFKMLTIKIVLRNIFNILIA